jgi:polysulfide reductase chain C
MSEIAWEIPVAIDLFFAGLGAGSFCLGAISARKKGPGWEVFSRMSSIVAPLAIVSGLAMLILDLRNKIRFWMTLRVLNVNSPMSIGVWLLSAFFLISLAFALCGLPVSTRRRIPLIGNLAAWNRPEYKNALGAAGIFLALGVSVYTGVLLLVSAVPLWRNLALPLLLFLSAISTGFAGGAIPAMIVLRKVDPDSMKEPLRFIKHSYRTILSFYFLVTLAFVYSAYRMDAYLMVGWSGFAWWVGVVGFGIVVPLILVLRRKGEIRHDWFLFGFVLIGGFLLRIILVLAGQLPHSP